MCPGAGAHHTGGGLQAQPRPGSPFVAEQGDFPVEDGRDAIAFLGSEDFAVVALVAPELPFGPGQFQRGQAQP